MLKWSHQIIVNHESREPRAECVCHNFQELGDLRERTRSHSQFYGLQKQHEKKKKTKTIFSPVCCFCCCWICDCLALATNNCVVHFSRFSPLTVLFCPSHDVCMCVRMKLHSAIHSISESFSVVYAFCWYSVDTTLLHKTLPNKLILFTFNRSFSAACVIRICLEYNSFKVNVLRISAHAHMDK